MNAPTPDSKENPRPNPEGSNAPLEKTDLCLGFIPLTDCAPLAVAVEKGFFGRYGLNVTLSKEASWANIRDKVALGVLDGAQMLAAMPIASSLGLEALKKPMLTAFTMDLNGNAITVSKRLYQRMLELDPESLRQRPVSAAALKQVIELDRQRGARPLSFAQVFPVSTHNYELRYWMASAGIDPDNDVHLVVIPPPQIVASLRAGTIDGFCVGEPWNSLAVNLDVGHTLITNYELWNNNPEKVFGVTREWAERHPNTHKAVLKALLETARWMDQPENRMEVVKIIAGIDYLDLPEAVVRPSLTGRFRYTAAESDCPLPDFNVFFRYACTFPWRSHAEWFITQMYRWGQLREALNIKQAAAAIYRPDLYREAAAELGVPFPTIDHKQESRHAGNWLLEAASSPIEMGPDRFFDGKVYDPGQLLDYLDSFSIANPRLPLHQLRSFNS